MKEETKDDLLTSIAVRVGKVLGSAERRIRFATKKAKTSEAAEKPAKPEVLSESHVADRLKEIEDELHLEQGTPRTASSKPKRTKSTGSSAPITRKKPAARKKTAAKAPTTKSQSAQR